jgi:hypothetical protein
MDAAEALKLVNRMYPRLANRRPEIDKNERYYAGEQALTFATDEWLKANGARYSEFSDNWCASVTNAISERTKVTGIKLRGDSTPESRDMAAVKRAAGLWDRWNMNEMDAQSSQGFITSFNAKRSYVFVWGDDAEITWEHPSNVEIEYDWMNPRKKVAALKTWVDETKEYANLCTATQLFKFERPRNSSALRNAPQSVQMENHGNGAWGAWTAREVAGEPWPLRNPMGVVPVVEVPNRPMLRGEPVSEITGVIPKQNAINLLWAYTFFAADYASMPARVLLGAEPPMRKVMHEDGTYHEEVVTMRELNETRFAVFKGENAKIGQWDAAKLDVFTDVIDVLVGHIASQTRTPPTYLVSKTGMSNVNAEGLKASEIGLVNKEMEFQTFATPEIREVFRLVALATGDTKLADEVKLSTIVWQNPEIRSESQLADALVKKKSIGYPLEYLMELDGIDPYDMDRIKKMIDRENESLMGAGVQLANESLGQTIEPAPVEQPV